MKNTFFVVSDEISFCCYRYLWLEICQTLQRTKWKYSLTTTAKQEYQTLTNNFVQMIVNIAKRLVALYLYILKLTESLKAPHCFSVGIWGYIIFQKVRKFYIIIGCNNKKCMIMTFNRSLLNHLHKALKRITNYVTLPTHLIANLIEPVNKRVTMALPADFIHSFFPFFWVKGLKILLNMYFFKGG